MKYSREEAKEIARKQIPNFLLKAKKTGYVCPKCGNGTGNTGDGIVLNKKDGNHYKCFKCGIYADIFELYGLYYGLTDNTEIFKRVYEYYGIDVEKKNINKNKPKHKHNIVAEKNYNNPITDFTTFFEQAVKNNNFSYLKERGISESTQRKFSVGYVSSWVHPKTPKAPATPRCIIPTGANSYLARDIRKQIPKQQQRYKKSKVGHIEIFNIKELNTASIIFITEGEIDAMSIYEVSNGTATAIAIGSTAYHNIFISRIKQYYNGQIFILMLDNDELNPNHPNEIPAGQKELQALQQDLQHLNIPFLTAKYGYKDPNEYLIKDRNSMKNMIFLLQAKAKHLQDDNKYNALKLLNYFRTIENQPLSFEVRTGFKNLDNNLNGGLHEGLIVIGAVSSLGKTTFALQLADQIAATGTDVIFFSLEMSKYELIAKSISRHTYNLAKNINIDNRCSLAKETVQILNNRKYKYYNQREKELIAKAIDNYEVSATNLYIYEGRYRNERLTAQHIHEIVKKHINDTKRKPVVIVDYLQILASTNINITDKQNIDSSVFELKEASRDYSIPIIAISSFNRENYLEPVSMTSFKESGAVEYSSDILIGLQYKGMDYQDGEKEVERKNRVKELIKLARIKKSNKEPIEIELKCIKNRNGHNFTILFYAIMAFNYLEEVSTNKEVSNDGKNTASFSQLKSKIPIR